MRAERSFASSELPAEPLSEARTQLPWAKARLGAQGWAGEIVVFIDRAVHETRTRARLTKAMPMLISFWRLLSDLTASFLRHGCGSLAAGRALSRLVSVL